jgi:hypothetical protein
MLPQHHPQKTSQSVARAQIYNHYLAHATNLELKMLAQEIDICLEMQDCSESINLNAHINKGLYRNIFKGFLYRKSSTNQLEVWNGTIGRRPENIIESEFNFTRDVNFSVKKMNSEGNVASGFKKYPKSQKTQQLLSLVGLLIVGYDQPKHELVYLSQYRGVTLDNLLVELEETFQMKLDRRDDKVTIKEIGPLLNSDPVGYLKIAFPQGYLARHGIIYQLY